MTFKEKLQCSHASFLEFLAFSLGEKDIPLKLIFAFSFTKLSLSFILYLHHSFTTYFENCAFKGNTVSEGVTCFLIVN